MAAERVRLLALAAAAIHHRRLERPARGRRRQPGRNGGGDPRGRGAFRTLRSRRRRSRRLRLAVHRGLGGARAGLPPRCSESHTTAPRVSVVYPVARGTAPVLVLLLAVAITGAGASVAQVAGVVAVGAGVLLVRGRGADVRPPDLVLAPRHCSFDCRLHARRRQGRRARRPVRLPGRWCWLSAGSFTPGGCSPRGHRTRLVAELRPRTVAVGAGMFGGFCRCVLAALERAPAAPVAAVRESSVVLRLVPRRRPAEGAGPRERGPREWHSSRSGSPASRSADAEAPAYTGCEMQQRSRHGRTAQTSNGSQPREGRAKQRALMIAALPEGDDLWRSSSRSSSAPPGRRSSARSSRIATGRTPTRYLGRRKARRAEAGGARRLGTPTSWPATTSCAAAGTQPREGRSACR